MTIASLMHEAGPSKPVLWDNPERWGGEGSGREAGFRMRGCFHLSKPLQGEPHPRRHRVSPVTSPGEREQVFDPSDSLIKSLLKFFKI